jgi:hypothetical protein
VPAEGQAEYCRADFDLRGAATSIPTVDHNVNPIAQAAEDAGRKIAGANEANLGEQLNVAVGQFAGWPYKVASGRALERDGGTAGPFASIVYVSKQGGEEDLNAIPADTLAAVIDASETADLDMLRASYARVVQAKRLKKAPAPRTAGVPTTTVTLGIIFALRSAVPLEELAEELQRLNAETPAREWPDMVVVANTGTINYAGQFPGDGELGLFLPPAEGALANYTPPMYVAMIMKAVGSHAFGQMTALLVAHLAIFSPGAKVPNFSHILEVVPQTAVMVSGYQYNLRGEIQPVPRQFYNDRYFPPLPMRIEDQKGELLSTIEFLPWQDGGVLLLKGKLPLDGLMIFLGGEALKKAGIVRRPPDLQISYVLPITAAHFGEMLTRLQRQSNMVVRRTEPNWIVQKYADEGSTSPFMARLFIGIMRLREVIYPDPAKRDTFDKPYEFVMSSLMNARATAKEIATLWDEHARKVGSGAIARLQGKAIHIDESVDKELRKQVESFLNAAVRALKQGTQNLGNELGVNIGFMFKQQAAFEAGIAALGQDSLLVEYLRQTRTWSEPLVETRNAIEHKGWTLPRVIYSQKDRGIVAAEPEISGQSLTSFVGFMLDRMCCFVEEFAAHCLQRRMLPEITITELPIAKRSEELPERFRLTLGSGGLARWNIAYHASRFEDT